MGSRSPSAPSDASRLSAGKRTLNTANAAVPALRALWPGAGPVMVPAWFRDGRAGCGFVEELVRGRATTTSPRCSTSMAQQVGWGSLTWSPARSRKVTPSGRGAAARPPASTAAKLWRDEKKCARRRRRSSLTPIERQARAAFLSSRRACRGAGRWRSASPGRRWNPCRPGRRPGQTAHNTDLLAIDVEQGGRGGVVARHVPGFFDRKTAARAAIANQEQATINGASACHLPESAGRRVRLSRPLSRRQARGVAGRAGRFWIPNVEIRERRERYKVSPGRSGRGGPKWADGAGRARPGPCAFRLPPWRLFRTLGCRADFRRRLFA